MKVPALGVGLFPTEPVARMVELAGLAEGFGYSSVWVGDSHMIWNELWVTMTACALGTSRVRLGTAVTNPLTRHPSVTASAALSLHRLSGGRVVLGFGLGDSAVRTVGARPVTLAALEQVIGEVRRLHRGETVETPQGTLRLLAAGPPAAAGGGPIPIYAAASGPKLLELAGRAADGAILLVGIDPRQIEAGLACIRRGAAAAGKRPESVRVVLWVPCAIGADAATLAAVKSHIARIVIRPLPFALDPAEQEVARQIKAEYDYYRHMDVQADHGRLVPDVMVDRFALAGTPARCADALRRIATTGVDEVAIIPYAPAGKDRAEVIRVFAEVAKAALGA